MQTSSAVNDRPRSCASGGTELACKTQNKRSGLNALLTRSPPSAFQTVTTRRVRIHRMSHIHKEVRIPLKWRKIPQIGPVSCWGFSILHRCVDFLGETVQTHLQKARVVWSLERLLFNWDCVFAREFISL